MRKVEWERANTALVSSIITVFKNEVFVATVRKLGGT